LIPAGRLPLQIDGARHWGIPFDPLA